MASTFTPNLQIEEPARGDDVGIWDTPVNANMTLLDLVLGGITTINMSAGSVVLSAAQFKNKTITLNSTLTGNVTVTFPTSFVKSYEIQNLCTGNFTVTLETTATGGQVICAPPGEIVDVLNDGANLKYKNLGRIGKMEDFYVTAVPAWITGCTVPPYLNCNGTTFSSATYPALATILGSTTLPDSRGRVRAAMNQGTARLTTVISDTLGAGGGDQNLQAHNHRIDFDSGGTLSIEAPGSLFSLTQNGNQGGLAFTNNAGAGIGQNVQPTYMGGLTLIRAA